MTAGTPVFHVHPQNCGALQFNPHVNLSRLARFSPWPDPTGKAVSSWYGGLTASGALFETIFRGVVGISDRTIMRDALKGKAISRIALARDLKLLQLHGDGLLALGLEAWITACTPERYSETVRIAERLHDRYPEAKGLLWRSRINNDELSLVLWGDRNDTGDFGTSEHTHLLDSAEGQILVVAAANRIDCVIA